MNKEGFLILDKLFPHGYQIKDSIIGGMMNESTLVESEGKKYIFYIPTEQANEMVDRFIEKEAQGITYSLNKTSKNIYFDQKSGIKINEYIDGHSLNNIDDYDINKVAELLKVVHSSAKLSSKDYCPFERFLQYENEAKSFKNIDDDDYQTICKKLFENRSFLLKQEKVFSHNDFQKSNIIKSTSNEYFLIDFEFAGNNDPIYDIAAFGNGTVIEGFSLLNAYYNTPTFEEKRRYYLWRMFLSLQWYLVAIVKDARGDGELHKMNFLDVANFFLSNAKTAYEDLITLEGSKND